MSGDVCYLCRRITPQDVFTAAHKLIQDKDKAHEMGVQACEVLKKAYSLRPTIFCGIKSSCILGGLFYLLLLEAEIFLTMKQIGDGLGITEVSVRNHYKTWLEGFPQFFPNCSLKMVPYGGIMVKKLHYRERIYRGISWPGYYEDPEKGSLTKPEDRYR